MFLVVKLRIYKGAKKHIFLKARLWFDECFMCFLASKNLISKTYNLCKFIYALS